MRGTRLLRQGGAAVHIISITLALLLGFSASHLTDGMAPTCAARCAPDCPMHANRLGCHHGGSTAATRHDCHHQQRGAPGVSRPGCQHRAAGFMSSDQPAVLADRCNAIALAVSTIRRLDTFSPYEQVTPDPPFRPPATRTAVS